MKDNIDTKKIGNRKIIIELRFNPIVSILDNKGHIVEAIEKSGCFNQSYWEINSADVTIRDHSDKDKARNIAYVTFNRFNFISYKVDSVDSFYSNFIKVYTELIGVIGTPIIKRIGCRIIGTYKVKSQNFDSILNNFKESFPKHFFIENYSAKDLSFTLNYPNGMYTIGPVNLDDNFYDREFDFDGCYKHIGIAIDTDNYMTNEVKEINDKSLIKSIYTLSLAVEKDLYLNLADY